MHQKMGRIKAWRTTQNCSPFADEIFLNENCYFVSYQPLKYACIAEKSALVPVMAWRRTGDKTWSEPMMTYFADIYIRPSASMN